MPTPRKTARKRPLSAANRRESIEPVEKSPPRAETWTVNVAPDDPPVLIELEELCSWLECDPRTIHNRVQRGMPRAQARPRQLFPSAACLTWAMYFEHLKREFDSARRTPPWYVAMDDAYAWHIQREHQALAHPCTSYILVPLDRRNPLRRRQLAIAAEGLDTGYVDDDGIEHPPVAA